MAIVFGSDTGVKQNSFGQVLDYLDQQYEATKNGLSSAFTSLSLMQPKQPPKENVFVDSGFSNVPGTAFVGSSVADVDDVQTRHITTQEPQITVYIKKRAFRALRNENDLKFMDSGEILFLRATKILFENKCQQLGAYEALTKAQSLLDEEVDLDYNRIGVIIDSLQTYLDGVQTMLNANMTALQTGNVDPSLVAFVNENITKSKLKSDELSAMLDGLRTLQGKTTSLRNATRTNWVTDTSQPDAFLVGRGSGVIELTLINDLTTSLALDGSPGTIGFTIQDPYNLTKITTDEIEVALSVAKQELSNPSNSAGPQQFLDEANKLDQTLNGLRTNRIANLFGLSSGGNSVLTGTDNTKIVFEVNVSSASPNQVTASIGAGASFNKDNFMIALLQLPPEQQTTPQENALITQIFAVLGEYVSALQNNNKAYKLNNNDPDVVSARRNLRLHYLGKTIVQPMDSVNVYIRSNTFKQDELMGPLSSLINNSAFFRAFQTGNDKISDVMLEEEMRAFGLDDLGITVPIYRTLRTDSLMRNGGTHVFGGIITTVTEDYSAESGIYTTNVSGASNMQWLELSRVNITPSLDQTQGLLEDPLTPFDIKTDPATGLVLENPPLNAQTQAMLDSGVINYNSGAFLGKKLSTDNFVQDYTTNGDGTATPQYKHAPGVTYKWKQGIITATRNVNLRPSVGDQEDQNAKLRREMGLTVTNNPFSGMDAANVVSTLVTGFPHNYESFYTSAMSVGNFNNNVQSNSPESYFHSFFDINRSQNRALGNFQPFKTITIDPRTWSDRLKNQRNLQVKSKTLQQLQIKLADLQDQLNTLTMQVDGNVFSSNNKQVASPLINSLKDKIQQINNQVTQLQEDPKISSVSIGGLKLYRTDFALDFGGSSVEGETENMKEKFKRLSLQNALLQIRSQYDCKFNSDNNLFIVGEEYDKDLDIEAFVANMSKGLNIWDSQYQSPRDICSKVAAVLDFEFFCDTNGHIQFRPPRYNKVPLSLLLTMFMLNDTQGKQLYPSFLAGLFQSRLQNVTNALTNVNLEILIAVSLLGGTSNLSVKETTTNGIKASYNIPSAPSTIPATTTAGVSDFKKK